MPNHDGGWRLPETIDPERFCVRLYIPKDRAHVAAFLGALEELTKWWNWERDTAKRGIVAAYVWRDILNGLAGLDYSEPTIRTDCDMPQFRMTPECVLEYSNDNGATWQPVAGWSQYASCFVGPAGPQGEQGPQGLPGTQGPQGEPGVVGAQVVRVDGDTPPDFYYTPETQILTAIMQEQWLRGLRAVREPGYPTIQFQVQTYDGQPEWITLMEVPDIPPTQFVFPQQPETLSPEDAKCLAAMNAAEVLLRTYNDVGTSLSGSVIDDPLDVIRIIAESVGGLIAGEYPLSTLGELTVILAFIGNQLAFVNGWPEEETERLRDVLLTHASVDSGNRVTFDYDTLRDVFGQMYDAEGTPWGNINYLLFFLGPNALNIAGAVAYHTEPDCSPFDWEQVFDFTISQANWNKAYEFAPGQYVAGLGWRGTGTVNAWKLSVATFTQQPGTIEEIEVTHVTGQQPAGNMWSHYQVGHDDVAYMFVNNARLAEQPGTHIFTDLNYTILAGQQVGVVINSSVDYPPQLVLQRIAFRGTGANPFTT